MKRLGDDLNLAATDLANHLACGYLTALDLAVAEGRLEAPSWRRPEARVLQERGLEHERAYLEHLRRAGLEITRLDDVSTESGLERTMQAMRSGAQVIVQATLSRERWSGRADVLLRVERTSHLGAWSYEVVDTKLSRETRGGTILQLCVYSDILAEVQGALPEFMHVVSPRLDFEPESFRVAEYLAYYRFVRRRLEAALAHARGGASAALYPEPVPHCDVCRWWPSCDRKRHRDDHLCLVAGISRLQTRELQAREVETLARLAEVPVPLPWKPSRGSREGYERVREQARVQVAGRERNAPVHELLPVEPERGLSRLPAPSPGDVFLDLEGDPYIGEAGLEYLFGHAVLDESGEPAYRASWALDPAAERAAFEAFVDWVMERWARHPDLHVYHFAPYEPAALKRLMGRYATREGEIDRMLRAGLFVDLYSVVRQGLRASVERYSIKDLERFYRFEREQPLPEASAALREVQQGLELGRPEVTTAELRAIVEAYNREDCFSALRLRDWLEDLRAELEAEGQTVPRPAPQSGDPSEALDERQQRVRALMERLLGDVPLERAERSDEQQARWLLAYMLEWHRREDKAPWWEYFRLRDLPDEELLEERAAIAGLDRDSVVDSAGRSRVDRFRFPRQETSVRAGDDLHTRDGAFGKVVAIDPVACTVDVKLGRKSQELQPASVFAHTSVPSGVLADSLYRLGEWVAAHGADAPGAHRAARDLLLGLPPRRVAGATGPLEAPGEGTVKAARRLALELDCGALAIQGPPGAGKTFTGARMILDLVRAGKKVGVSAVSHKVIANLLAAAIEAADEAGFSLACVQKVSGEKSGHQESGGDPHAARIPLLTDNAEVLDRLLSGRAQVAGGTAWLWSRPDFREAVDVLVVDEAGQMSLANVLAIAQGTRSLVLLGDPQQLEQPQQGSHPEGTGVSALEHVLAGAKTISSERGLFLGETWRLHPAICAFTSEAFYEGRLTARSGLELQEILGETTFAGAGLWFVPVEHDANQNASREEVEAVAALVTSLTADGVRWRDDAGETRPMELSDILVIAPYNAQVGDLAAALPRGARVGTVDRFQGQQAPVVICSMTTSTPADAPRGMEFLYSLNRLNVATSRARGACVLVGSPRLFEPECQTPRQMRLANAFCRFLEMARAVGQPAAVRAG